MGTYFPTKYDSARDEVIAALSDEMEGYGTRDDSGGDAEAPTGYFSLVTIPDDVTLDVAGDRASDTAQEYGVTPADVAGTHLVTTNSQGFVSVQTYTDDDEARRMLDSLFEDFEAWSTTPYDEA